MTKKIADNHSIKDLENNINGLEEFIKIFEPLEIPNSIDITELKKDFNELKDLPDKFNDLFLEKGWMAHDSLNVDVMKKAINEPENADTILITYYEENFNWFLKRALANPVFSIRQELLVLAQKDYFEERYHSCIPISLMMADGMINDLKSTGLFASNTDLEVWDSISGHANGLRILTNNLSISRKKTTTAPIHLPYRNGILHGRDINYNHKIVAIKSFVLIFYIADWAKSLETENNRIEEYNSLLTQDNSLNSIIKTITESDKIRKRDSELQKKWKARTINLQTHIIEEDSPEYTATLFLEYIKEEKYGKLVDFYPISLFKQISIKQKAGFLRNQYKNIIILEFEIINIKDIGSAKTSIDILVNYVMDEKHLSTQINFNMLYEVEGEINNRLLDNGSWKIYNIEGIINEF